MNSYQDILDQFSPSGGTGVFANSSGAGAAGTGTSTGTGLAPDAGYNLHPAPSSAWYPVAGAKPGQINAPPSIFEQLNANVPYYGAATSGAMGDINSMLSGNLSPGTTRNIWNSAASRGVDLGMPNSPISNEIGLGLTGQTTEGLQQQGLQDYGSITGLLGSEQNNPQMLADIAEQNAVTAAAPDPKAALGNANWLMQQQLNAGQENYGGILGTGISL